MTNCDFPQEYNIFCTFSFKHLLWYRGPAACAMSSFYVNRCESSLRAMRNFLFVRYSRCTQPTFQARVSAAPSLKFDKRKWAGTLATVRHAMQNKYTRQCVRRPRTQLITNNCRRTRTVATCVRCLPYVKCSFMCVWEGRKTTAGAKTSRRRRSVGRSAFCVPAR